MNPLYEVLIVGCGRIAGKFDSQVSSEGFPRTHAGAYTKSDFFVIRACVDNDASAATDFSEYWKIPVVGKNVHEISMLIDRFDVVSVCTPTEMHGENIRNIIELSPKIIFCEKPLGRDEREAREIVELCKQNGINLVVNYSRSWDPTLRTFISEIHAGDWGKVRSVVCHYNKGISNNGSHIIEIMMRLFGDLRVVSVGFADFDFFKNDPTVAVLLEGSLDNVPIYLNPGRASDYSILEIDIFCETGLIRMLSGGERWEVRHVEGNRWYAGYKSLGVGRTMSGTYEQTMHNAINEIYLRLTGEVPMDEDFRNILRVQAIVDEIIQNVNAFTRKSS